MTIITVCKDCPDRKVGCHCSCEKYQGEKRTEEEKRNQSFSSRRGNKDADDYAVDRYYTIQKKMRRR